MRTAESLFSTWKWITRRNETATACTQDETNAGRGTAHGTANVTATGGGRRKHVGEESVSALAGTGAQPATCSRCRRRRHRRSLRRSFHVFKANPELAAGFMSGEPDKIMAAMTQMATMIVDGMPRRLMPRFYNRLGRNWRRVSPPR